MQATGKCKPLFIKNQIFLTGPKFSTIKHKTNCRGKHVKVDNETSVSPGPIILENLKTPSTTYDDHNGGVSLFWDIYNSEELALVCKQSIGEDRINDLHYWFETTDISERA